eukprot:768537-Hanusia_phi.AAC.13
MSVRIEAYDFRGNMVFLSNSPNVLVIIEYFGRSDEGASIACRKLVISSTSLPKACRSKRVWSPNTAFECSEKVREDKYSYSGITKSYSYL